MLKKRSSLNISCSRCPVQKLCIATGLSESELVFLDNYIQNSRVIYPKEHLFFEGDEIKNIYAVYSGVCKDYRTTANADEHINEFYFPGDIIGLESVNEGHFQSNAVAICETVLCLIPKKIICSKDEKTSGINHRLFNVLCQKIKNMNSFYLTTNVKSRVAAFYLNVIERHMERYPNTPRIPVIMSHTDISNRIGIANETLSRVLFEFDRLGIIRSTNGTIFEADIEALREMLK